MKYLLLIFLALIFVTCNHPLNDKEYKISLAEWSLHRNLFDSTTNHLDFARIAAQEFDIHALEYVSQFFQDKARDQNYLQQMKDSCEKYGVKSNLIMVDGEGNLGDTAEIKRIEAVESHKKWIDAAHFLGCQSIRVNGCGLGSMEKVQTALVTSLLSLSDYAAAKNINILVENHGMMMPDGTWNMYSHATNGKWLAETLQKVNKPNIGALPDFGNFVDYDRYQGVKDLMPFAKGVSAKTFEFNDLGEDIQTDFKKMFEIIHAKNFDGYFGIEFEGNVNKEFTEFDGIRKTLELIKKYY